MLAELISMYVNGFVAFWRGMFGGGLLQWVLLALLVWWFLCRRGGPCACRHCGCWCGHCRCDEVRMEHAEAEPVRKNKKSKSGDED